MSSSRRKKLARIFGYAVSAACLAVLAFRVDWPVFVTYLRSAQPLPVALASVLVIVTYFLFALRWRLLLSFHPKLSLVQVASFLMLGYLGNLMLPMRAGDAARVLLIRNAYGHGAARALSSILLERLLDVLAVLLFGAAVSFAAPLPETILLVLRYAAAIVGVAILILAGIATRPAIAVGVVERIVRLFSSDMGHAVAYHIKHFAEALEIIIPKDRGSTARVAAIVALTACGWGSFGAAMVLCTAAFDVSPAIPAGLLMMVVTNLSSAIPSSPGSLGVYHVLAVLALSVWHVGLDLALSVATVSHAIVIAAQLLLGLLAMAVVGKQRNILRDARAAKFDS
jgi:glycosyltransferase 2 family protein